jgi:hypothetical protein
LFEASLIDSDVEDSGSKDSVAEVPGCIIEFSSLDFVTKNRLEIFLKAAIVFLKTAKKKKSEQN